MDNQELYSDLITKIEEIDGYSKVYKLFTVGPVSQGHLFESVAFREISKVRATIFSDNWRSLKVDFRKQKLLRNFFVILSGHWSLYLFNILWIVL